MSVLIPDTSSAIAPAARSERADTSLGKKPRLGRRNRTAPHNVLVMRDGVTCWTPLGVKTRARGVWSGALLLVRR
jgi:hypothetical protein